MTSAKEYIQSVFETVKARNGHEAEFLQAVEEFFNTLEPVFEKHPEYIEENILARITEPERVISFRVPWVQSVSYTHLDVYKRQGQSIWHDKDKTKDKGTGFKNEITPYLYNIRGALSMANTGQPNTNGSQFFINQNSTDTSAKLPTSKYPKKIIEAYKEGGNPSLDGKHPVFGQVIDGMDVVDKIAKAEKDEKDKPTTAITIDSIEVVKDYDFKS